MTAQYKPYRDEESVDGLETTSWTDNEPSSIQIYEKTTEELPFHSISKKSLWSHSPFYLVAIILGFLIGYFAHFHSHDDDKNSFESTSNFFYEDATIKVKLLNQIDGHKILETINSFSHGDRTPGSSGDHRFVAHVQDAFISYGLDPVNAMNYTFKTMLPKKNSVIKIIDKSNKTIYSTETKDDLTQFLPLSQAEESIIESNQIIYINKGLKEDYIKLPSLGINANQTDGKIFVIRQTFYQTHDVVIDAQANGASAILLFPDPDTYGSSSPFPESVQLPTDASKSYPLAWSNYGDLASLNFSSLSGVIDTSKLGIDKESKVQIPVILISFEVAKKLLVGLSGTPTPREWNCFDFTLHVGPGYKEVNSFDARDRIKLEFYNQETTVTTTTVTGVIAGAVETDRYIVLGSRRDSLSRGVLDSISGTAVMLEIARVFGGLVKQGWRPRRTIVFNSFGSESFNLIGSSNWLEEHQKLLHSRAVAYINCDLIVTGNQTVTIAASPLLYQVLYNATRQVPDPNDPQSSIYKSWYEHYRRNKVNEFNTIRPSETLEFLEIVANVEKQLESANGSEPDSQSSSTSENTDVIGNRGSILQEYKKSAITKTRPKVRRLDLQSIYSPFFLYAGIPVVDVRFTGFPNPKNQTNLLEDTLPLLGTKYDTLEAVHRIDPHLHYHVAVAQVLSEILRDLSDSVFLPFNLLDYAITSRDSYSYFVRHYGKSFAESSRTELEMLKQVIDDFTKAVVRFHYRQDRINPNDAMQVRKCNDQMMLLERAFLDSTGLPHYSERKHLILAPNDGQDHRGGFPALVDWITMLEGESLEGPDYTIFIEILKVHYKAVIYTISNAIKIIDEVHIL